MGALYLDVYKRLIVERELFRGTLTRARQLLGRQMIEKDRRTKVYGGRHR